MTSLRHQLLAAALATPLLLLGAASPATASPATASPATVSAAAAETPGYAALGDSYAAGVASGSYDPSSGSCHRSAHGYPALWAAEHHPAAFLDAACTGATTEEVISRQLPSVPADTGLVTVTAGGNDLGFTDAVVGCLQPFTTEERCTAALDHSGQLLDDELPGRLDRLLTAVAERAPGARVVVTGYPHLLETGTTCFVGTDPRRVRFDALTDRLDDLLQHQATAHGARFADPRATFAGHGVCAPHGAEWITRIVLTPLWESFHPTAEGQSRGFLPPVAAALS